MLKTSLADRKWFAKALWGWGSILHDRSWIERRSDGNRDPQRIHEAQAKFREFVQQVSALGPASPLYAEQSRCASRYVANPVPESLSPCAGRPD